VTKPRNILLGTCATESMSVAEKEFSNSAVLAFTNIVVEVLVDLLFCCIRGLCPSFGTEFLLMLDCHFHGGAFLVGGFCAMCIHRM